jgi:hypothetical protein
LNLFFSWLLFHTQTVKEFVKFTLQVSNVFLTVALFIFRAQNNSTDLEYTVVVVVVVSVIVAGVKKKF